MPNKKIAKHVVRFPSFRIRLFHLLFLAGFIFIAIPSVFYVNEYFQLSYGTPAVKPVIQAEIYSIPLVISIPAVGINLPIFETAIIHNNAWQISPNGVSHLDTSARPGQNGPIILYAHNTDDRFGPIRWLTIGEKISVQTQDKRTHVYTIVKTEEVSPRDITLISQVTGETLILYTCSGFADLQRFLVFAVPKTS